MNIMYYILAFLNLITLLFNKRKLDFITIYFLSSLFYYLNIIWGEVYTKQDYILISQEINDITYIIMIINMGLIFLFQIMPNITLYKDRYNLKNNIVKNKNYNCEKYAINTLACINFIIAIYIANKFGLFSLTEFDKLNILSSSTFIVSYFKVISIFMYVYIFTQQKVIYNKITYILIMSSIGITFLLGHRSYIVIGSIAIIFNYIYISSNKFKNMFVYIIKYKKLVFVIAMFGIGVYIIKGIYVALFTGQYELVIDRLTNIDYYIHSFKLAESNTIMKYINTISNTNYKVSTSTYIIIITYFIPFISRLFSVESFSSMMQRDLFPSARKGSLGSTFIGEAYANGGIVAVFIFIFILLMICKLLYDIYKKYNGNLGRTFILLTAIELAFYIHRNGLATTVIRVRSYIYILILLSIMKYIYKVIITSSPKLQKNNK